MGNDISASNSIQYYQKEILGSPTEEMVPIFKIPKVKFMENHDLDETSIVFLYSLDTNRDGYLAYDDISNFVHMIQKSFLDPNDCDFGYKCGALFTKNLSEDIINKDKESFKSWVIKGINSSFQISEFDGIGFIDGDAVKRIYDLLQIQQLLGRTFQWVLDMLQRHAEANLKMNLNDPAYDDLVPIETMVCLIQQVSNGMMETYNLMTKR